MLTPKQIRQIKKKYYYPYNLMIGRHLLLSEPAVRTLRGMYFGDWNQDPKAILSFLKDHLNKRPSKTNTYKECIEFLTYAEDEDIKSLFRPIKPPVLPESAQDD